MKISSLLFISLCIIILSCIFHHTAYSEELLRVSENKVIDIEVVVDIEELKPKENQALTSTSSSILKMMEYNHSLEKERTLNKRRQQLSEQEVDNGDIHEIDAAIEELIEERSELIN